MLFCGFDPEFYKDPGICINFHWKFFLYIKKLWGTFNRSVGTYNFDYRDSWKLILFCWFFENCVDTKHKSILLIFWRMALKSHIKSHLNCLKSISPCSPNVLILYPLKRSIKIGYRNWTLSFSYYTTLTKEQKIT